MIVLNYDDPVAQPLAVALQALFSPWHLVVILDKT